MIVATISSYVDNYVHNDVFSSEGTYHSSGWNINEEEIVMTTAN